MEQTLEIFRQLAEGFGNTVLLFALTLVFSLPLGLLIAFGAMSRFKPLKYLMKGIVWVVRGTPLMLQILAVSLIPYYVFGVMNKDLMISLNVSMQGLLTFFVVIAFVINYSCYFSEIFRGGIQSIPKGQYEAAQVLGLTKKQIFFKVILFQLVKKILAPVSNEVITLVKDTALAQVLGVVELFNAASHAGNEFVVLTPLIYAAIFYLIFNGLLTILFGRLEKRFGFYKE